MGRVQNVCDTCRHRKIKCDTVQPVCGPCSKNARQCGGVGYSKRLIVKDETDKFINKYSSRKASGQSETFSGQPSSKGTPPRGHPTTSVQAVDWFDNTQAVIAGSGDLPLLSPYSNDRLSASYQQHQLAIFCCRKTLTLRTFTWVMSETKWVSMIHDTMSKSQALASAVRANAANYLGKSAGAPDTPIQALTEYAAALKYLQKDLYDPVKQRSDETLFTVLLLGLFDMHNRQRQDQSAWHAHIRGACKIIQCNGAEHYTSDLSADSPTISLVEYVRGIDVVSAVGLQEGTMFGAEEWDCLRYRQNNRPIDVLFALYGKLANLTNRNRRLEARNVTNVSNLVEEINLLRYGFEDWKQNLPPYYEPQPVPVQIMSNEELSFKEYPYDTFHNYVAGTTLRTVGLISSLPRPYTESLPSSYPDHRPVPPGMHILRGYNL